MPEPETAGPVAGKRSELGYETPKKASGCIANTCCVPREDSIFLQSIMSACSVDVGSTVADSMC